MSVTFEEIAGDGITTTKAATFVGEAYLAGGTVGLILGSAFFWSVDSVVGALSAAPTSLNKQP
jgi:hypothetical protein